MLKKTITYTDYDGNERTEDFYFNLSESELTKMQMSVTGGMQKMLNKMVAEQDEVKMMDYFEKIILMSYGEKSDDGRRFRKSAELSEAFKETEAYNKLFMELITGGEQVVAAFINGIIPKDVAAKAEQNKITSVK